MDMFVTLVEELCSSLMTIAIVGLPIFFVFLMFAYYG